MRAGLSENGRSGWNGRQRDGKGKHAVYWLSGPSGCVGYVLPARGGGGRVFGEGSRAEAQATGVRAVWWGRCGSGLWDDLGIRSGLLYLSRFGMIGRVE